MSKETPGAHLVPGLRRAVELVEWRRRSWGDSVVPAAIATLDEMLVYLRAEIERGGRPSTIQLMDSTAGNQPQRQDALTDQLRDVMAAARRLGCYDAEDWIRTRLEPMAGTEPEWCPGCADPSVLLCAKCGGGRVVSTPSNELARGDGRMCGRCNAVCDDVTCDCNPDCEWPEPMPSNGSKEGT